MPEVTIYQVAASAGVSIATVSNAINTPTRVKPETLHRVLKVIDELGFVPKSEAVVRARKGIKRIGVVAPLIAYPSFGQRLRGVIEALRDKPYEVVVYDQQSLAVREAYLTSLPISRRLDGLIVMSLPFDNTVTQRLLEHKLETVLVEFGGSAFSSIEIDNEAGGRLAAEHLLARGHRRCAFVGERSVSNTIIKQSAQRLAGFRGALARAGTDLPESYVSLGLPEVEETRRQTLALLELDKPPTAVFAHSDLQAVGVLKAARVRGLRVPEELAVIGFDDLDVADYLGLTTVRQPLIESGRIAAQLLLARLSDPLVSVQRVTLPLSVIERETT